MFHVIKEKTSSRQKVAKNVGFFVFLMRLRSVVISCLNHENSCSCGPYGKWKELKLNCESRFYELFGEASLLLNILHATTTKKSEFPMQFGNHEKNESSNRTVFENHSKCLWHFPLIFGLYGNTIWPQTSGFQIDHFWQFQFCPLKM